MTITSAPPSMQASWNRRLQAGMLRAARVADKVAPFWIGRAGIVGVRDEVSLNVTDMGPMPVVRVSVMGDPAAAVAQLPPQVDGFLVEIEVVDQLPRALGAEACGPGEFYDLAAKECIPYAKVPAPSTKTRAYCMERGGSIVETPVTQTGELVRYEGKHGRVWETALPNAGTYDMCAFPDGSACRADVFEEGLCDPDTFVPLEAKAAADKGGFWTPWTIGAAALATLAVGAAVVLGVRSARKGNPVRGIVNDRGEHLRPWDREAVLFDIRDIWSKNHKVWASMLSATNRKRIEERTVREVEDVMHAAELRSYEWDEVAQVSREAVRADLRRTHEQRLIALFQGDD